MEYIHKFVHLYEKRKGNRTEKNKEKYVRIKKGSTNSQDTTEKMARSSKRDFMTS